MEDRIGGYVVSTEQGALVLRPVWPRRMLWLELAIGASFFAMVPLADQTPLLLVLVQLLGSLAFGILATTRELRSVGAGSFSKVMKKLMVRDGSLELDGRPLAHQPDADLIIGREIVFSRHATNTYYHVVIRRQVEQVDLGWFYTLEEALRLADAVETHLGVKGLRAPVSGMPSRPGVPWQAALPLSLLVLGMIIAPMLALAQSPPHGPLVPWPFWASAAVIVITAWLFARLSRAAMKRPFARWVAKLHPPPQ